jgi:hypothetical protein
VDEQFYPFSKIALDMCWGRQLSHIGPFLSDRFDLDGFRHELISHRFNIIGNFDCEFAWFPGKPSKTESLVRLFSEIFSIRHRVGIDSTNIPRFADGSNCGQLSDNIAEIDRKTAAH